MEEVSLNMDKVFNEYLGYLCKNRVIELIIQFFG